MTDIKKILYKYKYAIFLAGIAMIVFALCNVLVTGTAIADLPSEERCQKMSHEYSISHMNFAARYYCEYSVTGWHFNRTAYNESLKNGDTK